MSLERVALIFDNTARPETTGLYCRRALGCLVDVEHFLPTELDQIPRGRFDLFLRVDDGLRYEIPDHLRPQAFWAIDTHMDFESALNQAQTCDVVFAAQKNGAERLTASGCNATWLPLACDPVIHRPFNVPVKHDICFVGNVFSGPRKDLLDEIARTYPQTFVDRRYFEQMAQAYSASRTVFNRSVADDVNMRVFEALGCGRLLLTNDLANTGQDELFQDGLHLATYSGAEELLDKLAFYLERHDLRERVAWEGRTEVLARHTYLHRMTTLLRTVERKLAGTRVSVPADVSGNPTSSTEDRKISACLVSWKRPENVRRIVDQLLDEPLIDDIVIWNNNPNLPLSFTDPRVSVIQSDRNRVTYGRYLAARQAKHDVIYTQDDDCLVHNLAELHETFRLDGSRIVHGLKLGHLIDNPRNLFGSAHMALVGWGALFRREWVDTLDAYIERFGEDELLDRKADRIFSVLLNRRHRPIPAAVTDLAGTDGPEALSVRDDHMRLTAEAIERCLPLLKNGENTVLADETNHGRNGASVEVPIPESQAHEERTNKGSIDESASSRGFRGSSFTPAASLVKDAAYFEFDRPDVLDLVPTTARRVLDIGCGAGRLGVSIKARQQAEVVGVERNSEAATAARNVLDDVLIGDVDSEQITFQPDSFDCVICADVLEHLRNPEALLKKISRWLRPDGCLVTSIPNVRNQTVLRSLLAGNWTYESAGLLDEDHVRFFTRSEIEKLLFRTGFEPDELRVVPGEGYDDWEAGGRQREISIGGLQIRAASEADAEEFFAYQYLTRSMPVPVVDHGLTSIIVVTHNQFAYTRLCVDSIRMRTDEPYELIFVDNGSTDDTLAYLHTLENATVIANDTNLGFPVAVNQGIAAARGDQILLLNNDTVVTTGWLHRMLEALNSAGDIGLVGPVSNNVSGEQQVEAHYTHLSELDGFAWRHSRLGPAAAAKDVCTETDRLVGFCLLIKRRLFDDIGNLDEQFGIGCFEDDDLCRRALDHGYRAVIAHNSFVHHFGSVTFQANGVDFAGVMQENQRRFERKWNAIPSRNGHHAIATNRPKSATAESDRPRFLVKADETGALRLKQNTATVTLCMIVRDNETTIRPCLESIQPWVDEMVIVDTGSTDATPQISEELGARVFHWPWRDDFAAARNESLKPACGEWIFWMDSDDTIPEECGRKLRELVDGDHDEQVLGYTMQVHCPGKDPTDVTAVDHVKLFRNRPDLRFEFRIHEQIIPAIRRAGGEVAWTDLYVVHSGSDHSPEGRQRKLERDFRLLELELADRPDHPFVLFNLGMTHADAQQHPEAADYLRRCIDVSQPDESHLRKAYALLVSSLSQCGQTDEAWEVCRDGVKQFAGDKELLFRRAMLEHEYGRLRDAERTYQRVLNEQTDRHFISVDQGLDGYKARHNLAVVYEEMGCLNKAEAEWRQITEEQPEYGPGWLGLAALLLHQGDVEQATVLSDQLKQSSAMRAYGLWIAAKVAEHQQHYEPACSSMEQAVRRFDGNLDAHNEWCRLLFEHGDPAETAEALKELISLSPNDAAAHHNLAATYERLGFDELALKAYGQSLLLRPDHEPTEQQLALLRSRMCGSGRDGALALETACQDEPVLEVSV